MAVSLAFSNTQTGTGATHTSTSFTPSTGDIIVVKIITEDASRTVTGPPAGGGWTYTQRVADLTASHVAAYIYTAPVTTGGTAQTVATTVNIGTINWLMTVEDWAGAQLAATPATVDTRGSGAPSTTITTAAAGSVVSWADGDWAAVTGTATYGGGATQDGIQQLGGTYCAYAAWQNAASAGSQTLSMSAPAGQTWTLCGIEVQASGAAPAIKGSKLYGAEQAVRRAAYW